MRSESPDTEERDLPETLPSRVVGPLLFSVLLHGVVLVLFARAAFAPAQATVAAVRPDVTVALVMRPPPRMPAPVSQDIEELSSPTAEEPAETAELVEVDVDEVASAEAVPGGADATDDDATESVRGPGVPEWTPARIRAAIEAGSGDRRSTLTQDWVGNCILEKKEHGTRDCERQQEEQAYLSESTRAGRDASGATFDGINRPLRHAHLVEGFERNNAAIEPLMADTGVLGVMATERYFLNRRNIAYLTGNGGDPVFAAMQGFRADPLGGPRLSLPGNIRFRCKVMPCVYEFTGFNIERPEAEPEEGEFQVVPLVLGNRR